LSARNPHAFGHEWFDLAARRSFSHTVIAQNQGIALGKMSQFTFLDKQELWIRLGFAHDNQNQDRHDQHDK